MNKPTYHNLVYVVLFSLFVSFGSMAQTYKPFTLRKNIEVRGSMLVVGNSILGKDNQPFNDLSQDNQDISMQYIDIDNDASTFSSSSADLLLHDQEDGSATTCYRVAYAALYWGAVLQSGDRSSINQVKLKLPGSSTYTNITGELVYDAISNPIVSEPNEPGNTPYACYAEVTDLLSGLSDLEGTYTVADVTASLGSNYSTGLSAGWTLFVIYEDPNLHTKSFNVFDGFSHIYDGHYEEVPVTGFSTPPVGAIDLQFAYAALDGDRTKRATKLEINGKEVTTPFRTANKFFGSVIENENGVSHPRNPFSENTLGYDTGFLEIKGSEPEYIKNNDSSASFILQVARGQADPIFAFFSVFAVDIISPDIDLTKKVSNTSGEDIDGDDVVLGQNLFYEITYQSVGNDNVTQFTLKDVLPDNIVFDPSTDIDLSNAGGATLQSYDPVTRTLIFNIPDGSVEVGDPKFVIRLAIQIVPNCYDLSQACSNEIKNQAFATYRGVINPTIIEEEGSFATTECLGVPGSTNFIVDISNCDFTKEEVLCGNSVELTAAGGYDSYSWSTSPTGTPVIGTTQSITVTETGTYYVQNTTQSTCLSINETFNVITFGSAQTNPVIPYADLLPICPNDGKVLPYIFLCGGNDTRNITTGISDAVSIIWEKLDETSCAAVAVEDCANEDPGCTWNQIATGPNYTADTAGQFRIVINYPGGCFAQFYFNVYSNLLTPTISAQDILCTTPGQVVVGNVPSGYEYSLDANGPFQPSNTFDVTTPGYYTVYIRQVGVDTNPCIFETPSIYVRDRDFSVTTSVTQPGCHDGTGSIQLAVNNALPQYNYSISQGGTLVNSVGPILASDYTFSGLNPGTYTVNVTTDDGCTYTEDIDIIAPPLLEVTAAITKPLTCTDGEITVYPTGGTPPYYYFVNSTTDFQTNPEIVVSTAGVYNITVVDSNNCSADAVITIDEIPAPDFSVSQTNILCNGDNSGSISFNVTNANGYTINYSIDNGTTFTSNPNFYSLAAGTYQTLISYALNGEACFSVAEDIVITETPNAVTASGGVSELAGCGPNGEGRVRITNPQGGTPPYEYSFDNQSTWTSDNEAYVAPGTYTLYIRDANECMFAMPGIVLEPEPEAPSINISDVDYNCDGTGNTTVTVNNSSSNSYSYGYLIDGVENPNLADPQTFLNVSEGSHTISVTYKLETVPTFSNLLNEDFGSGAPTTTSGIASAYCFNDQRINGPYSCGTRSVEDNQYSVASFFWRSDDPNANNTGAWYHFSDHTTNGTDPDGRFLLVNIGSAAGPYGVLYSKPINDVIPNQDIQVDLYVANLMRAVKADRDDPDFRIQLVDGSGNVIAEDYTGIVPKNEQWNFRSLTLNPGNNTSLTFVIRSGSVQYYGNDALIDDISVYQLPKTCIEQVDFPFIIDPGQAFSAEIVSTSDVTCSSAGDGSITIAAQNFDATNGYQYSIDGGATWSTTTTSPYTISNLTEGAYNVVVRYDAASNGLCESTLQAEITAPSPLSVSATTTPVTCLDGSTVTASATGGTPTYTYELLDASLNVINTFPANGILTNVPAGDYTVRATDANGCLATTTISLVTPTAPTASIVNADYCYDVANGATLEVLASGGQTPYEYSVNGGTFQSSAVFNNLTPGSYVFTVRDAYGCEFTLPAETIAAQVNISATLTKELDCTASPDAVISGTISDGYAPYTVTLIQGSGTVNLSGNTFTLTTGVDGAYQFQVTDANGCTAVSNVITVNPIENPTATTTTVNPSCNGSSNGSVQIVPSGGVGPYTFSFDGSPFTTTSLYTGLVANVTYAYQVQDANECIFNGTVTLTEPTTLVASASATAFSCAPDNTKQSSTVTIAVPTTGTAPYTYSFNGSGYSATNTLIVNDNGTDQTIDYAVQDANGCTDSGSLTISALNPPTDLDFSATVVTCDNTTATVTLTATNGVGVLTYEIISPIVIAPQTSNTFPGLAPDTYVFRVTDENGCYYTESFVIEPVTPIAITALKLSDVLCFGGNDGAAQFEVFNATNFTYTINGGSVQAGVNPIPLSNLIAGTYTVEVTDTDTGCIADASVTIDEPTNAVSATATATNVHCNNFESQITVTASGGTPNYTYAAVISGSSAPTAFDYGSSNVITVDTNNGANLVWDVYVKDANGCTEPTPTTVTITPDTLPSVTAPIVDNQCDVSSGFTFTVSATDGVPPYSYSINGGASYQSSPTFTVNAAGSYTVTVRDANGCTGTATTATEVFEPITVDALLTKDLTCSAPAEATIDGTISGGNAPYSVAIIQGTGTAPVVSGNTFSFSTSTADDFQFEITDANGCTQQTGVITVSDTVDPVILNVTQTQDISCNGEETAAIQVNIDTNFGFPPFVINVHNDDTGTDYGTQTSGLPAGDYTVTVTDARGCDDTETITINEPDAIVPTYHAEPITCIGAGISKGSVIIDSVTGGTAPYNYFVTGTNSYSNSELNATGSTSVSFDVVDFGLYQINIVDANGCSVLIQDVLVASPPDDLDIMVSSPPADCSTGGSATVTIGTPLSGSGPYHFAIYTGPGMTYTAPTTAPWQDEDSPESTTFTNLIPGATYTFIVYDEGTQCYYYETADTAIPTNSTLNVSSLMPNNITCVGSANGNVSFDINSTYGTPTDISYEVLDSQSLQSLVPVISGTGTVPANGTLSVSNLGNLDFGNYVVVITEQTGATNAGCSIASDDFNITESAIELNLSASSTRNENCNELGLITAIASNGTAPYEYQVVLDGNAPADTDWASSNTFERAEGLYDVYVRDAYGCIKKVDVTVVLDAQPTINPAAQQCFDGTAFSITLSGTTFNGNATYSIGGAYQTGPNFTLSAAGTYDLYIKDDNGCTATTTYTINPPLLLDAILDVDLTCTNDAQISLTASGGTGTYNTYEVSTNGGSSWSTIAGTTYTATTDDTYLFKVIDSQSCEAISNEITVTPNTTPTLTYSKRDVTCNGGADGSIIVTAANGIAPYEYSNDGGATWQASNVFSGLAQGVYDIQVRDSKDCLSGITQVTIIEPTLVGGTGALTQSLSCGSGNVTQPALVTISANGGTAPYTFSFDGGINYSSTNTYTTYNSGTVTAWVKDANGCVIAAPIDVVIPALDVPTDLDFASNPITCNDPTTDVILTATDGVGVLTYEIISPVTVAPQASNVFTGLTPNTYTFTVTDENGCYYTESYTIEPVTNITVSGLLISDALCTGDSNGAVDFTVANYASAYTVTLLSGTGTISQSGGTVSLTNLVADTYTIEVTDATTGCTDQATIVVSEPTTITLAEIDNINANCNFGAQVTVQATGGTSPYEYAFVVDSATPTNLNYANSASAILDPATSTDWDVWVRDANGCTDMIDVTITTDPLPTVTVPSISDNQCNLNGDPFTFTVTSPTGIAPFSYSIGTGFQTSPTFTVSTPGTYNVIVMDGNGCTATMPTPIEIYPTLDLNVAATTLPSCSDDDGVITVTGTGGSGNYSYAISPNTGIVSGNVISGLAAGSYTVTITDIDTGCDNTAPVILEAPTPVTFTTTPTDVSCNGSTDGTITVNLPATNDNPIYTYSLDGGVTTQTSNVFTGLAPGTYNVTVTSGRNCTLTQQETVGEPNVIVVPAPTVIEYACTPDTNAANFATITVSGVTGGSNNYTIYEFYRDGNLVQSSSNNVYTEADLLGGNYTITVYDDHGCSGTTSAVIAPYVELEEINITIDNAITCLNDEDITVSATTTGGSANLQYTVAGVNVSYNQTNTTGNFTGLIVGNYTITVENLDTGCSLQTTHYVNVPNTFELEVESITDVTCFSDNDGSITFTLIDQVPTPTNDAGPFTYEVLDALGAPVQTGTSANAGPLTINGLPSGTFTINATLTNAPFCTVSTNATITAPNAPLEITESHTEITCNGNDGTISAIGSGGWPGAYEYQLMLNGSELIAFGTQYNFTGLAAGNYMVNVRDSQGCVASATVVLADPLPIAAIITPSTTMLSCFGDTNASITVSSPTGGQGSNYTYTLNRVSPVANSSGPQISNVFTDLGAGTYNVIVTDGYNCSFTTTDVTITEPSEIVASLVKTTNPTCLTQASLTLSATGGTGPYEYSSDASLSNPLGTFTTDITFTVVPGTYRYYVRDANGCTSVVSNDILVEELPELIVTLDKTNATINCAGDSTGVIVAEAQGGLGNYVYTLQDDSGNDVTPVTQDSPGVFTELPIGRYQVYVESGDCDVTSEVVEITEPSAPVTAQLSITDVTCNGANDGMVEITASGGTGIIKYAISPQMDQFFDEPIFDNLLAGDYQIIVQDELGCYILLDFTIDEPLPVMLSIVPNSILPEVCSGDLDGAFSIEISGGSLPYSVSLDDINGVYTTGGMTQTQFDFDNLAGGDHIVYVRDAEGCESEWNITFPESVFIDPQVEVVYGCVNNNLSTNTVTVSTDASIDANDLDYSLNGGPYQSSNVFIDVPAGVGHYISVRHTNGCEKVTSDFDIEQYDPLVLAIDDGEINQIVATATGGAEPYEFTLNGESYGTESSFYIYASGDYTVTVTDANGCQVSATRYFEYIDVCIPNYFTPNDDGNLDKWGPGCADQYKDLTFDIFDRYGRKIASLRVGDKWDGKYNGQELPTGDYWYVVKLNDPKDDRDFVGHFTLYR
ncbi:T9SS type B sorting domain-containing protein [Tamlana fucoidanivorans]|uniref:T9SS type B sorting domain-containing protein n=1 Tax=Allotamlana fucoidanivorans TaxID=2583814 RepID=A0A5C4SPZ9_9FLAO|nr:T9SS type B sorting domain-containing protein [Tamlana fucoidanivorans]TNJ46386.1 T9SS type B sorting domain-containing protein [Tamlana fucoidanivorans]